MKKIFALSLMIPVLLFGGQQDEEVYMQSLKAVSPLDGRAVLSRKGLEETFSESALHRQRVKIQLMNLKLLSEREDFPYLRALTNEEKTLLEQCITNLTDSDAEIIARLDHFGYEGRKPLDHDVKASEYYTRRLLKGTSMEDCVEFAYFPFTSEDVNNIAYNLMLADTINNAWLPAIYEVCDWLRVNAEKYRDLPVLALTHGQPASPTTMGKRFGEFLNRFTDTLEAIHALELNAKCSGPVGNHNAIAAVCPEFDYPGYAKAFVESLGFEYEPIANQRNPHVRITRMFHLVNEMNNHLQDLASNLWLYILKGWMEQIPNPNQVGSSVMPQKVNPWRFESAQGYAELSNAMIKGMDVGLLQSHFERDLSDHPWERAYGEMIGYSMISAKYISKGLKSLKVNEEAARDDVESYPEVLAEAIQIAGRVLGLDDPYDQIKQFVRGKKHVTQEQMREMVVEIIDDPVMQERLLQLTPSNYTGKAAEFADQAVERYDALHRVKLNTSNAGKLAEYQKIFEKYGFTVEATQIDLDEIDADALSVILHKSGQVGEGVLVEDTSLDVEGEELGVNIKWLLDNLSKLHGKRTSWTVFLAKRKGNIVEVYKGEVHGTIVQAKGENGFGFDPYFLPDGATKTLAEDKPDKYNARALAVEAYVEKKPFAKKPAIFEWAGPWQH